MSNLKETMVGKFTALGKEIEHNGKRIRPDLEVSVAVGRVTEIQEGDGVARVIMNVTGAKYAYHGYVQLDSAVEKVARRARDTDTPICLRFENKRKKDVNPETPMADLKPDMATAQKNIVNILVGAFNLNTGEWILTSEAQSNPAEDEAWVKDKIMSAVEQNIDNFFDAPPAVGTVDHGYSNPAEDKANHLISLYCFLREQEVANNVNLNEQQRAVLAEKFLHAIDSLQVAANNLPGVNYKAYSHTKARQLFFQYAELNPLTADNIRNHNEYINNFLAEGQKIWAWAISKSTPENFEEA